MQNERQMAQKLRAMQATGRIVLSLQPDSNDIAQIAGMSLEDQDRLIVPARPATVNVLGAVYNANAFMHSEKRRTGDYLRQAGGPTRNADKGRAYIIQADGSVLPKQDLGSSFEKKKLNPGDSVVVPEQVLKLAAVTPGDVNAAFRKYVQPNGPGAGLRWRLRLAVTRNTSAVRAARRFASRPPCPTFAVRRYSHAHVDPYRTRHRGAVHPTVLAVGAHAALPSGITQGPTVEGITEYRLANGLTVLLFPDASKPKTTVNVTYRVGSAHENYGETGMAHLLEHLVFKGTPSRGNIMQELGRRGMDFNGTTSWDRTNYFESFTASTENLDWALRWRPTGW